MVNTKVCDVLNVLMGDMSESALARAVNLPKATIHRVLSGDTPDPRAGTLLPIAQYFNITIEQLMGASELPKDFPLQSVNSLDAVEMPLIPLESLFLWLNGKFDPKSFYKITSFSDKPLDNNCFITQVISDEMAPLFPKKTYLIAKKQNALKKDDIIIGFYNEDNSILVRKYTELKGEKYLIPSNLSYEIISFDNKIKLIGIVIEGRIII